MSLDGLATALGNNENVRQRLLKSGRLLSWPSSKTVGVISGDSLRLNVEVMTIVADIWCPQWEGPAMIRIDEVKEQACLVYLFGWDGLWAFFEIQSIIIRTQNFPRVWMFSTSLFVPGAPLQR